MVRVEVVVLDSGLRRKLAAKMTLKVTVAGERPKASKLELAVETAATSLTSEPLKRSLASASESDAGQVSAVHGSKLGIALTVVASAARARPR